MCTYSPSDLYFGRPTPFETRPKFPSKRRVIWVLSHRGRELMAALLGETAVAQAASAVGEAQIIAVFVSDANYLKSGETSQMLLQICSLFLIWIWSKRSKKTGKKGKRKLSNPKLWSSLDAGFGPAWHATTDCFGTEVVIGVYGVSLGKGWCFRKQLPDTQVAKYCHLWGDLQMIAKGILKLKTTIPKSKCWMITLNWKDGVFSLNGMAIRAVFFHLLSKHAVLAGVATMTSALHRQFTKRRVA